MPTESEKNLHSLITFPSLCLLVFYGTELIISFVWLLPITWRFGPHLGPLLDLAALLIKVISHILFFISALFLLRRKIPGLRFLIWGAGLNILSVVILKLYILGLNLSQGMFPDITFFLLTFIQSLIWPIFILWIVDWVKRNFR